MSTLGKVLLVINLLASAGFLYLATQDWAKGRQVIEAAGLRYVVLLQGLPLGDQQGDPADVPADPEAEVPFRVEMAGGVPTTSVSPEFLKKYFAAAGPAAAEAGGGVVLTTNKAVATQVGEVRRVLADITTEVGRADGPGQKARVVAPLLVLQPETYDERVKVLDLIAKGAGDQLWDRLKAKFDQVLNPVAAPDLSGLSAEADPAKQLELAEAARAKAVKDGPERRARLAHLLVHLGTDPGWQKRVMLVVGVRRYVAAVGTQAVRFGEMAGRVERLMADDQSRFAAEYTQLQGLAIQRTQTVRDTAEVRARLALQAAKDRGFVDQRQTQIKELTEQLRGVKADVDAMLAKQKVVEDDLFAVQREVGLTLERIYQLQDDLDQAERAKYGEK